MSPPAGDANYLNPSAVLPKMPPLYLLLPLIPFNLSFEFATIAVAATFRRTDDDYCIPWDAADLAPAVLSILSKSMFRVWMLFEK